MFYECQLRCSQRLSAASLKATRVKIAMLDTGLQLAEALRENNEGGEADRRPGV